jgi:hypothetical protein
MKRVSTALAVVLLVGGACTVAATVPRGPSEAYLPSAGDIRILGSWEGGVMEYSDPAGYSVDSARYPAASSIEVRISHRSEVGWPAMFCVGVVDAETGEHVIAETCHDRVVDGSNVVTLGPAPLPAGEHMLRLTARTDPPLQTGHALIVESDWVRIRW